MTEQFSSPKAPNARQQVELEANLVAVAREQYRSLMKAHREMASTLSQSGLSTSQTEDWYEFARMMVKWFLEKAYGSEVAKEAVRQDVDQIADQLARQMQSHQLSLRRMLQTTENSLRNRVEGRDLKEWSERAETAGRESLDSVLRAAVARLRNAS